MNYLELKENEIFKIKEQSDKGQRIHSMLLLLDKLEKLNQTRIVDQSKAWALAEIIPKEKFSPLRSTDELSKSKPEYGRTSMSRERIGEIHDLLEQICSKFRWRIKEYPSEKNRYKIGYERLPGEPAEKLIYARPRVKSLAKQGLVDVLPGKPIAQSVFKSKLASAYEIRILQSSLFNSTGVIGLLRNALENGKLYKVRILLGQPFSQVALNRSRTYGEEEENQFAFFNNEIQRAISGITQLAQRFNGKPKNGDKHIVDIQLRLYYRSTSIPIYQFRNEKSENEVLLFGIYWHDVSSYKKPHLRIDGKHGDLLATIEEHFDNIWKDCYPNDGAEITWQDLLENQKTVPLELLPVKNEELFDFFQSAETLRAFFPYRNWEDPVWISFKCFYFNFRNQTREFLLRIAPKENIAHISKTYGGNEYYGICVKLHSSYVLFLHITRRDKSRRIITLRIPVGDTALDSKDYRLAVYTNNDLHSGSPYSQMMLLRKIDGGQSFEEIDIDYQSYMPYLQDRKIHIPAQLWNKEELGIPNIREDYQYYFSQDERKTYFSTLLKELDNAEGEVYFLGYPPGENLLTDDAEVRHYYLTQERMMTDKKIRFYRIILDPSINSEFTAHIKRCTSQPILKEYFHFYASKKKFPILNDLILIDPESKRNQTAILSFIRDKRNKSGSVPIRMEVIREESSIIEELYSVCLDFVKIPDIQPYDSYENFKNGE